MANFFYLTSVILLLALVTFITRILPFVLLYKFSQHPLLGYLGRYLPAMVMVLLVIYSLKQEIAMNMSFLPELGCVLLVAITHIYSKHSLLSIVAGTGLYMLLVQTGYA